MIYAISFRIEQTGDHQNRWASTVKRIKAEAKGTPWDETTSFFVIESDKTTAELERAIYVGSDFNASLDLLLVISLSYKMHEKRGDFKMPTVLENLLGRR